MLASFPAAVVMDTGRPLLSVSSERRWPGRRRERTHAVISPLPCCQSLPPTRGTQNVLQARFFFALPLARPRPGEKCAGQYHEERRGCVLGRSRSDDRPLRPSARASTHETLAGTSAADLKLPLTSGLTVRYSGVLNANLRPRADGKRSPPNVTVTSVSKSPPGDLIAARARSASASKTPSTWRQPCSNGISRKRSSTSLRLSRDKQCDCATNA